MNHRFLLVAICAWSCVSAWGQEKWTLQRCLDYASENNIQLQKARLSEQEGEMALWQSRGQLRPSLSFQTQQSASYRPFETSMSVVENGRVANANKITQSGNYGLSASYTVWNGGINLRNIKLQEKQNEITKLNTQQTELTLQEQITQFFVQILYLEEAMTVNKQLCETAQKQYERGVQMQKHGQMSKADVANLEAKWRNAEYNIVSAETQLQNTKRQLKAILELPMSEPFETADANFCNMDANALLPDAESVFAQALQSRPEVKSAELGLETADMNLDIAKRGYYPTITLSGALSDSHYTGSVDKWGPQMKQNLNMSAGVGVSVPIYDQRRNKTNVERAKLQKLNSELSLQDVKNELSSTIEQLWLNAKTNQQKYVAAQANAKSQQTSYELLNAQFNNGLKNITELAQGHDALLSAKQEELQSKYTALLNMELLKLYMK